MVDQIKQHVITHTKFIGQVLQFAISVFITFGTIGIVF